MGPGKFLNSQAMVLEWNSSCPARDCAHSRSFSKASRSGSTRSRRPGSTASSANLSVGVAAVVGAAETGGIDGSVSSASSGR